MAQSHRESVVNREMATSQAYSSQRTDTAGLDREKLPSPARKRPRHSHQQQLPEANTLSETSLWSLSRCNRSSAGRIFIPTLSSSPASSIAPLRAELEWKVDLGKCIDASPLIVRRSTVDNSTLLTSTTSTWAVIGSHSADFVCVDLTNSGNIVWKRKLDDRIEASAAMSERNETLFVSTYSGALYALDASNGAEKWVFRAKDAIKAAVLVIDALQLVVCGAYDHRLYGIDSVTGAKRWEIAIADNGSLFSTPVYVSESSQLYFASTKGNVSCVALRDASGGGNDTRAMSPPQPKEIWAHQLPAPVFSSLNVMSETVGFQLLGVGCADGNLYAMSTRDGEIQWRVTTNKPIFSSPCVYKCRNSQEALLFGSHDGVLRKVSCQDGHVVWKTDLGNAIFSSPSVFDAVSTSTSADESQETAAKRLLCCVAMIDGTLFVCDEATGEILTSISSSSSGCGPNGEEETALGELFSSPVVVDDLCLIGSRSNQLYAFRLTG